MFIAPEVGEADINLGGVISLSPPVNGDWLAQELISAAIIIIIK
jgi:hypothetical protein